MTKEIWKDVVGYEGFYEVSNIGNIKSRNRVVSFKSGLCQRINGISKKKTKATNGYLKASLSMNGENKTVLLHRLVAIAFIPNPEYKSQVNHINSNRIDNRVENLEWATPSENIKHGYAFGNIKSNNKGMCGSLSKVSKRVEQLDLNDNTITIFDSLSEASNITKTPPSGISKCCNGKRITSGGFKWRVKTNI